jgi:hypothetical protein
LLAASRVALQRASLARSVGLQRMATRESLGTASFRSSSRLPRISSPPSTVSPVTFRPDGRDSRRGPRRRDRTRWPSRWGWPPSLAWPRGRWDCAGDDDVDLEPHQLGGEGRQSVRMSVGKAIFDDGVLACDISQIARPSSNAWTRCAAWARVES